MSTQNPIADAKPLTFRRFRDGDSDLLQGRAQIFQASWSHKCPTYVHRTPPCQGACPSGEDVRGWLGIVRGMEKPPAGISWEEYAFRRSTTANPFPSVMGRVCPAPCQTHCNRNAVDDYVGINAVEQFIGDTALAKGFQLPAAGIDTGKHVAIIGGGPAGLSAAYQLRLLGHTVTIFDDHADLGGMMRYGIPAYRTPREMLSAEIQRIIDLGVHTRLNTRVGRDISLEQVEQEFDAILWALGCKSGRALPIKGADAPNCLSGVAFLSEFNQAQVDNVPKRVVVVGGGDTSIDVASVARRLGHARPELSADGSADYAAFDTAASAARQGAEVTLTSLFPKAKMTAAEHEVQDALREGVSIHDGVMPVEVLLNDDGYATGLKLVRCEMKNNQPTPIEGTEYVIEADVIIAAIGQYGDLSGLDALNNGRNFIDADAHYQVKDREGHFVAGDIIRPHLLTTAIGQGSIAAESIDLYLKHDTLKKRPKVDVHHFDLLEKLQESQLAPEAFDADNSGDLRGTSSAKYAVHNYEDRSTAEIIKAKQLFLGHFNAVPREQRATVEVTADNVIGNYVERSIGLDAARAQTEAKRCMSCGMCFECDNCVVYCPQKAVKRTPKKEATTGRYVYTDYDRCIGCHICADVCPTGYINMGLGE